MHYLIIKNIIITIMIIAISFFAVTFISTTATAEGLTIPQNQTVEKSLECKELACNPMLQWIQFFINALSVLIVAGSALMMAVAGLRYITSRDNAQAVQDAKSKIFNILTALVAYFFLFAFVQWLIPGGVF